MPYFWDFLCPASQDRYSALCCHQHPHVTSDVSLQILTSFEVVDFRQLNIISLCSVILATLVACCLPSVTSSIYFHNNVDDNEHNVALDSRPAFEKLKGNFVDSFGQESVFRWSLWWALGMAGNLSVKYFHILELPTSEPRATSILFRWEILSSLCGRHFILGPMKETCIMELSRQPRR